jgi:uncharacterized membrane protein YhhN
MVGVGAMMPTVPTTDRRPSATLAYAGIALADAALAARGARRSRRVTKPLLMPVLHLATRPAARRRVLARSTAAAHLLSWGGDVALLADGRTAFLTGVGSFAGAHAAYIAGFLSARDAQADLGEPGPRAAAAAWLVLAPAMAAAAGSRDPELRLPVAGYAAILCAMVATSTTVDRTLPAGARRRIVAGTALFLLSDGLLGAQEFLLERRAPALEAAVMLTYTAGQWCIADGVGRALDG